MEPIIEVKNVSQCFPQPGKADIKVLNDCNLSIYPGEIVALLGKSGSGKSTLLRVMSGLLRPTSGEVLCRGKALEGPVPGLSMVFQNFALFPWLTVLQNVELGLEALGVGVDERRERALRAIDIVGMDGFESAYPRELSGGMSQRVGLARALVVEPDVLLMDEPFSALDVLTSENLRADLLDLWLERKTKIQNILLVTHNIEEAASLADRILIFGSNPGYVKAEITNTLPHPRSEEDRGFKPLVDTIYQHIASPSHRDGFMMGGATRRTINISYRLPNVSVSEISGLLETLSSYEGEGSDKVDLPELAEALHLDVDDLFQLLEIVEILRLAIVKDGNLGLTETGSMFAQADILDQKKIFARQLLMYIPLVKHIRRVLDERPGHRAQEERFLSELQDTLSEDASQEVLKTVIDWGRYAELFAYHANAGMLSLDNPE